MKVQVYDVLNDENHERLTLFRESPIFKLRYYYIYMTVFLILLIVVMTGGTIICDLLWKEVRLNNNTNTTLQNAVISITVLYVIIDILLMIGFGYYFYRSTKIQELMSTSIQD